MDEAKRKWKVLRWVARIWSVPAILWSLAEILFPHGGDAYVPWYDWVLLGLMGLAVIGLALAWRWEALGGWIAIAGYLLHVALWPIFRGSWAMTWLIFLAFVGAPGLLFVLAARGAARPNQTNAN
jgi:hypothetical protein